MARQACERSFSTRAWCRDRRARDLFRTLLETKLPAGIPKLLTWISVSSNIDSASSQRLPRETDPFEARCRIRRLLCGSGGSVLVGDDRRLVGCDGHLQMFRSQVRRGVHRPAVQGRCAYRYPSRRLRPGRGRTTRTGPRCFRAECIGAHPGYADDRRATQFQCALVLRARSGGLCDEFAVRLRRNMGARRLRRSCICT